MNSANQKQLAGSVSLYANDNRGYFPPSIAVISSGSTWNWHDPRKIVTSKALHAGSHRSITCYLKPYINDFTLLNSPHVPSNDEIMKNIWNSGDSWDHPATFMPDDQYVGSYSLFWNYLGSLDKSSKRVFTGPKRLCGSKKQSSLLLSDYFGFGHWTEKDKFGSSVKFSGSEPTKKRDNFIQWWTDSSNNKPQLTINSAYTDGSVRKCPSKNTTGLWIAMNPDATKLYDENLGMGPGMLFIPQDN